MMVARFYRACVGARPSGDSFDVRGAPRDALVADITPMEQREAAFGLRQSLDTISAFLGPMLALAPMLWLTDDIRAVLWFAVVPAVLAVVALIVAIRDSERRPVDEHRRFPWPAPR
jgi:hypothetical protein